MDRCVSKDCHHKGTVSLISIDLTFTEEHPRFTSIPFKHLTDQRFTTVPFKPLTNQGFTTVPFKPLTDKECPLYPY